MGNDTWSTSLRSRGGLRRPHDARRAASVPIRGRVDVQPLPTIDAEVRDTTIRAVIRVDRDLLVETSGGTACWWRGGHLVEGIAVVMTQLVFALSAEWGERVEAVLIDWKVDGTPVYIATTPDATLVVGADERFVLPRTRAGEVFA